jgi:hypothetical protein
MLHCHRLGDGLPLLRTAATSDSTELVSDATVIQEVGGWQVDRRGVLDLSRIAACYPSQAPAPLCAPYGRRRGHDRHRPRHNNGQGIDRS